MTTFIKAKLSALWVCVKLAAICLICPRCWWRWMRVIWVCRVPVISAFAGGGLLAVTAQARDLFADLGLSTIQWAVFFALLFAWAILVHVSARRALLNDDWVPEAHTPEGLSETRRLVLREEFCRPAVIVPRVLGLMVFGWIFVAIWRAEANLTGARGMLEAAEAIKLGYRLAVATGASMIVYIGLIWLWARRLREPLLAVEQSPPYKRSGVLLSGGLSYIVAVWKVFSGDEKREVRHVFPQSVFALALGIVFMISCFVAIYRPHWMAELLPRVLIAPVLLGGVVLPLTELAMVSHRLRTPFLLILVGLSAFLLYQFDRFHDVRIATSPPDVTARAVGDSRQVALSEAVARWRAANLCPNPTDRCPRPILIAGAGGASRAAFLTATVVGALIDVGNDSTGRARYDNVRNRIFAMSTVSGSSLGGIVVRAALADAAESDDPTLPPCSKATSQRAWFRAIALPNEQRETSNPTRSWRDCFQLLLAGDFLSPVLVGLVYRDLFPIGWPDTGAAWSDRAALLEQAFERRYHAVTRGEEPATCGTADAKGLCRRFGWHPNPDRARAWLPLLFINGTSVSTGRRIVASDIAMGDQYDSANQEKVLMPFAYDINEFGRMPREGEADPKQRAQVQSTAPGPEKVIDILMSTAVTISARFPLISPHGNFRDRLENLRDKVVDGGYFENDGLATVGDVAAVLRYHFGLDPVVIRVLNEPTKAEKAERPRKDRPPIPDEDERTPFDGVTSIFRALTATRSGHEDGHEAYLKSVLGADATTVRSAVNGKHRLYEVRVYELEPEQQLRRNIKQMQLPERNPLCRRADIQSHVRMDHVSMSWWMSHPVQAYLDAQLCVEANWKRLECELIEGRAGHGGTCEAID